MLKRRFENNILNLRPYSWVDLILLGYLAKFSITKSLIFSLNDLGFITGLLFLWFFFNLALEAKHDYNFRGKTSLYSPTIFLVLAIIIAIFYNFLSLIPLLISVVFILLYLQKNKNKLLGISSSIIRGVIEASFFFFAITLLNSPISKTQFLIGFLLFLIYASRALIGDIRDGRHNKEANKQTVPVVFGVKISKFVIILMLIITSLICFYYFNSFFMALPLVLFAVALIFSSNGYILHQLMIFTTSFFHLNFIAFFTNQSLVLFNLIYLGILLNCIFYPLLQRKSNPITCY